MSPILTGVIASGISGHLTPPWSPEGAFDALASVTVGSGGVASVSFTGIPSTYKHLQLRAIARTTRTGSSVDTLFAKINNDTANYYTHGLIGNGSAASAYSDNGNPNYFSLATAASATSNAFSGAIWELLDYSNTTKNKTIRVLHGYEDNSTGSMRLTSSLWSNTAAVSSVTIYSSSGNLAEYSSFALYGVK